MSGASEKRFHIRDLRIKSRRDWVIFWAFAVMIAYVAGGMFDTRVNMWLPAFTAFKNCIG